MDRHREVMVSRGLIQVHTGLGILLGAGHISSATHEQILALVNTEESSSPHSRPGQRTLISGQSNGVEEGIGSSLRLGDKPPRGPAGSISSNSPRYGNGSRWPDVSNAAASQQSSQLETRRTNIQCPWWSTQGYKCREHEKGLCAWVHEDIPDGIKDPLICSFWADGHRCNKSDDKCRFAHYWAQHRQIAPQPNAKYKKPKRDTTREPW
ncbi:hypothetical protein BJ170DRAFT_163004 [Xylariales sp. AK1849]|nr:hypothetical protein BJ170DRAFT_163004 [Xylariales sp. AK1849]